MTQRYRHYNRTEHTYVVTGHHINEADLSPMVAYTCEQTGVSLLRPVENFYGIVTLPSGEIVRRFTPLAVDGTGM